MIKGYIFDLDGVIVDTAKYHFQSWRRMANELGFDITEEQNENLKGVSRIESLEYILSVGGVTLSEERKLELAEQKNRWYVELISGMDEKELLPGAAELLIELKENNKKIALGSASKNSLRILRATKIIDYFDAIIDGTKTTESKPHPQVFLMGADELGLQPSECVVFEDSINGVKAANTGGFLSIGIGDEDTLSHADHVFPSLAALDMKTVENLSKKDLKKVEEE